MSASSNPVADPACARATARFTLTVDFPTPPLPEAMAMLCLIPFPFMVSRVFVISRRHWFDIRVMQECQAATAPERPQNPNDQ